MRKLSIIIPIYNVEAYLPQCLESIAPQLGEEADRPSNAGGDGGVETGRDGDMETGRDGDMETGRDRRMETGRKGRTETDGKVEVILVDDGSTDRSGRIADAWAASHSCVRVLHRENGGVAAARNAGMDVSCGEWLYFMDSDDWLAQDGVALLLCAMAACPHADMILLDAWQNIGARELPWEHFKEEAVWDSREELQKLQRAVLYYPMEYSEMRVPLAAPWDKLYRRDFLKGSRLRFREELRVLDDMVFNMEVLGKAETVAYQKARVCHYRHVPSSITNRFQADRVRQDMKVWRTIERYRRKQFQTRAAKAGRLRTEGERAAQREECRAFEQAYFCRVIRSFAICCKRSFYRKENGKSYREIQAYVRRIAGRRPYRDAFLRADQKNLEWRLKAVVFLIRHDFYGGLYLLCLIQRLSERVRSVAGR